MPAPVRFAVTPADPRAHLFEVRCTVVRPDPEGQRFSLPSWIRGSYLVRDFAKHIVQLAASADGAAVAIEPIDKRSFRCAPVRGALTLRYSVYAFDESVRKAWLDTRRGFFNGSSLFYCPDGFADQPFEVELRRPTDAACRGWRVATTLPAQKTDGNGFGRYRAPDYESLIDHPVEMGEFERLDFTVDRIPHALVLAGRYEIDRARVVEDLKKICGAARALFDHEPRVKDGFAEYLFLTHVVGSGYGGLEHRSSTALICSRGDLPQPGAKEMSREYRGFLGLCSHEYFHSWNVKRITPQRFAESDLAAEAYTQDLWHYEGVTSYYDDLLLRRAGVIEAQDYLDLVAQTATRMQRAPGHRLQTLARSSFEAWTKYYQPDENTPNATVSYYVKGALVALCLDLTLRLKSRVTLDDVMRALWQRHGARGVPVPEGGLEAIAQELSGLRLKNFFDRALRSTEELPLAELLAEFGVEAKHRAQFAESDAGGRGSGTAPRAWAGLKLRAGELRVAQVASGSPAEEASISANDVLVALDGLRLTPTSWPQRLAQMEPGRSVALHLFRGDELLCLDFVPSAPPLDTWTLTLKDKLKGPRLQRRRRWLGA